MADKVRHSFGDSSRVADALAQGVLDRFDVLFLDSDTDNPKFGWISPSGKVVMFNSGGGASGGDTGGGDTPVTPQDDEEVIRVDVLPTADGDPSVVYRFQDELYIWSTDLNKCIPVAQDADVSELESQVDSIEDKLGDIETQIESIESVQDCTDQDIENLFK